MNVETVSEILSDLTALHFFPGDERGRMALVRMVCGMASTEEQVAWLVRRLTSGIYNEWPGLREQASRC